MRDFEASVAAFFRAVSFEAGGRPDYEAIRGLFVPQGLLIRALETPPEITDVDGFIAPRLEQLRSGALTEFAESEISGETRVFGNVAQRWSHYDKRGVLDGNTFAARGWISTQFARTPRGWLITAMAWDDER
ncbi:DUF4440 domain-containing protein [Dactylosporangium sp. NPDC048998]|uniref:DUF4440 domain-containing protein n=1 Tax=Dactylosporangium sp. NPDC048998 TaxID=3363976 RepID=UPI00371E8D8E